MSLDSSLLPPAWPIGSAGIHSQDKTNKSRSSARGTHIPSPTPLINTLVIMASGILRGTAAADKDLPSPGSPCRSGWGTALFLTWGWGEWQDGGHQVTALQLLCGSIPAHSPTCIPPPGAFAHHMSPAEPSDWPTMTSPYFKARLQAGEGGSGIWVMQTKTATAVKEAGTRWTLQGWPPAHLALKQLPLTE